MDESDCIFDMSGLLGVLGEIEEMNDEEWLEFMEDIDPDPTISCTHRCKKGCQNCKCAANKQFCNEQCKCVNCKNTPSGTNR